MDLVEEPRINTCKIEAPCNKVLGVTCELSPIIHPGSGSLAHQPGAQPYHGSDQTTGSQQAPDDARQGTDGGRTERAPCVAAGLPPPISASTPWRRRRLAPCSDDAAERQDKARWPGGDAFVGQEEAR